MVLESDADNGDFTLTLCRVSITPGTAGNLLEFEMPPENLELY